MKPKLSLLTTLLLAPLAFLNAAESQGNSTNTPAVGQSPKPEEILALMQKVGDWQLANPSKHHPRDWTQGAGYTGIMALSRLPGGEKYQEAMRQMGEVNNWAIGVGRSKADPGDFSYHADDHCVGQTYIELYQIHKDPKMLSGIKKCFDFILENPPGVETLQFFQPNGNHWNVWSWCDSLFMAPPAWVDLYNATGDERYLNFALKNWWRTTDYLYDTKEHLFFRDDSFFGKTEANGQKVFWCRGNGWVMSGLARMLDKLPANNPDRARFEGLFKDMAAKIVTCQQPDGLWRASLLDPASYPLKETSGSAFFTYALAWGVNRGLLDRATYAPAALKGWAGLVECVEADGKLTHVQPIGEDPKSFKPESTEIYGVGAFLLAGSEIYRMQMNHQEKPAAKSAANPTAEGKSTAANDRDYHVQVLDRIARPVMEALAAGKLKQRIPVHDWEKKRAQFALLEITARTLSGLAPWLALGADETPEGRLRAEYIEMARKAVISITDPSSPDFGNLTEHSQPLVDAAYLAYALLRAPKQLWEPLTPEQRSHVVAALETTRAIQPLNSNWLLFSAMVECALWELTGKAQTAPIEKAVESHLEWYVGDGTYGDGPEYHCDYYNSYVIQPFLLEILSVCKNKNHPLGAKLPLVESRAARYAQILERMISPEGTYPLVGRSSVYRFAAFHHLAYMALSQRLPQSLEPGALRSALTAVVRRMVEAPGTFDENGWLQVGAVGHQVKMRDGYNNTGSLYICLTGLIALGLPPNDPFWKNPASAWTQKRAWAGEEINHDNYLQEKKE